MKVPYSFNDVETSSMLSFLETLVVILLKVEIQIVLTIKNYYICRCLILFQGY